MKKRYILCLMLFFTVLNFMILINPAVIFSDDSQIGVLTEDNNNFAVDNPITEINPALPDKNNTFFPILITSIVVLGILIFAMYQTFKCRRQS